MATSGILADAPSRSWPSTGRVVLWSLGLSVMSMTATPALLSSMQTPSARLTNASPVGGQSIVRFYHGEPKRSRAFAYDRGSGEYPSGQSVFSWVAAQGTRACIEVVNANPVFYAYSLGSAIDSTSVAPDLSAITAALATALSKGIGAKTLSPATG
jgi:hypothetical protein